MNSRRSFFQEFAVLSALAALAEEQGLTEADDTKLSSFWDAYFNAAARDPALASKGSSDANLIDPSKKVQLIQATSSGLRYPDGIANSELTGESDVVVTVDPYHFRPAPDDHKAITQSKGAQVRLDLIQTRPVMNLLAPMVWSGLAAWSLKTATYTNTSAQNSKAATDLISGRPVGNTKINMTPVGDIKDLDFRDPNNPNAPVNNKVILIGGSGRMALNVRAVSVNNRLQTVLDKTVQYSSVIAPFFGFSVLALPALKTLTELLGVVFNHRSVIMNSMPLQVLATQNANNGSQDSSSVRIVNGDYIAVPTDQTAHLQGNLDKLRVVEGWLVHQDTKTDMPVAQRAQDPLVPKVTYLSMKFTVQSLAEAQKDKAKG
jgi:hypothetical protein